MSEELLFSGDDDDDDDDFFKEFAVDDLESDEGLAPPSFSKIEVECASDERKIDDASADMSPGGQRQCHMSLHPVPAGVLNLHW